MASVRLTQTLREQIEQVATKGAYDALQKEIDAKRVALSERIYRSVVSEEQERIMKRLPAGFFNVASARQATVRPANGQKYLHLDLKFTNERRLPAFCSGYNRLEIHNDELYEAADSIKNDEAALSQKRDELTQQVRNVLNSANTVQKLLEIWPESESFIPKEVFAAKASLPAIVTGKLNELLQQAKVEPVAA